MARVSTPHQRLGSALRELRERAGLSPSEVSRRMELVPGATVLWESGRSRPDESDLERILVLYDAGHLQRDTIRRLYHENRSSGVFLSYRRSDSPGTTGRIYDALVDRRGIDSSRVFMDVGSLELGVSFVDWIRSRLDSCRVMLVVMGEDWAGRRDDGSSRLDDPEDWVRIEVETALGRGIYVIPILVDDAEFPREEDLPGSLVELRTRTGLRVTNARFRPDIEPVLDRVEDLLAGEPGA